MRNLFLLVSLLVFFAACGPSVESETKAWDSNKQKIEKLKAEYPAYVALFDQKMEQAKTLWDAAAKETDEDAKAKKMSEANNLIDKGPIAELSSLKSDLSELKSLSNQMDNSTLDERALEKASDARKLMRKAKDKVDDVLNRTEKATVDEAVGMINKAKSRIEEAKGEIKSVIKQAKKKEANAKKTEEKKDELNKTDETKTTTPEVKMIKCKFCGNKNKSTDKTCSGCGSNI